jgi:hypothetical protein
MTQRHRTFKSTGRPDRCESVVACGTSPSVDRSGATPGYGAATTSWLSGGDLPRRHPCRRNVTHVAQHFSVSADVAPGSPPDCVQYRKPLSISQTEPPIPVASRQSARKGVAAPAPITPPRNIDGPSGQQGHQNRCPGLSIFLDPESTTVLREAIDLSEVTPSPNNC